MLNNRFITKSKNFRPGSLQSTPQPDDRLPYFHVLCQDPASLSQPLNISHQWQNKPLPVAAGSAEEAQSFPEWTHHHTRFRGSDGWAGMHIHQCAHKGRTHRLKRKNQKYIPRVLLGRWRQCNAIRWGHDGIYHEILHCPEGIMGLKEEEVKLWKSKGCCKAVRVTGCVCVCVRFNGVFCCDESGTLHEIKTTVRWHNSPTDRRFLCVPEIHAPPSRCLVWGCRGSDLQRASCWADWATASPSHPAPPSAHHLAVLNVKIK